MAPISIKKNNGTREVLVKIDKFPLCFTTERPASIKIDAPIGCNKFLKYSNIVIWIFFNVTNIHTTQIKGKIVIQGRTKVLIPYLQVK